MRIGVAQKIAFLFLINFADIFDARSAQQRLDLFFIIITIAWIHFGRNL